MINDTYCIFHKLPDGDYRCVDEVTNLETAQSIMLVLEADHPGEYLARKKSSGKVVHGAVWTPYVC